MLYYVNAFHRFRVSRNIPAYRLRRPCMLWNDWWLLGCDLRSACARTRTFLWLALCLAGMTTRKELLGVTRLLVFRFHLAILRVNGMAVLAGDGIQVAKAGKKMPAVK